MADRTNSAADAIASDVTQALNPHPDVVGCPGEVAVFAASATLRSTAEQFERENLPGADTLRRWADDLDTKER